MSPVDLTRLLFVHIHPSARFVTRSDRRGVSVGGLWFSSDNAGCAAVTGIAADGCFRFRLDGLGLGFGLSGLPDLSFKPMLSDELERVCKE